MVLEGVARILIDRPMTSTVHNSLMMGSVCVCARARKACLLRRPEAECMGGSEGQSSKEEMAPA